MTRILFACPNCGYHEYRNITGWRALTDSEAGQGWGDYMQYKAQDGKVYRQYTTTSCEKCGKAWFTGGVPDATFHQFYEGDDI